MIKLNFESVIVYEEKLYSFEKICVQKYRERINITTIFIYDTIDKLYSNLPKLNVLFYKKLFNYLIIREIIYVSV